MGWWASYRPMKSGVLDPQFVKWMEIDAFHIDLTEVLRVLGSWNLTKFNGSLDKICCNMCRIVAFLFLWFAIMSFSLQKLHRSIT